MPTRKHSLSDLGTDVLLRILRHIPFEQCRKELPLVSKHWRQLLREPEVWHGRMSFKYTGLKSEYLGRSIAWILRRTHEEGTAGIYLGLRLLSQHTTIQNYSTLLTALKKEILELTVEFLKPLTERESTNLAKQQQPKSIADLDRLCSLSLHGCSCFGCLQNTPQLATLSSLTRLEIDINYRTNQHHDSFPTALLAITQLAALTITGCTTDIPNGISALRQLTSLEYWSQVTCPSPQLSCLRALESLAVAWHGENEEIGVDNNWVEGIACLPSLKELGYNYFARVPSEFYALQLTSLNLGFNEVDDVDDVEQVVKGN